MFSAANMTKKVASSVGAISQILQAVKRAGSHRGGVWPTRCRRAYKPYAV